jgi:hypothetical protein
MTGVTASETARQLPRSRRLGPPSHTELPVRVLILPELRIRKPFRFAGPKKKNLRLGPLISPEGEVPNLLLFSERAEANRVASRRLPQSIAIFARLDFNPAIEFGHLPATDLG